MNSATSHAPVRLSDIRVQFNSFVAVDDVSMDIESGEFFTLLGPSGCGKTTLLRTIAGFIQQSGGSISIGSTVVDRIPPYHRDTGMVFQNYAIFPHLSVWKNVAYGLRSRGVPKEEADVRVREALEMVDLMGLDDRMPKNLSGGQQQRVVIARAIVIRPRVLLMDEPLANLDAKLRVRLREDLRMLQQRLGITTIYVTHDQEEALSISDRIAVMSHGHVLQLGTPEEVYEHPAHISVARFIGEGTFARGVLERTEPGRDLVRMANGRLLEVAPSEMAEGPVWFAIRPHELRFSTDPEAPISGTVKSSAYYGPFLQLVVDADLGEDLIARVPLDAVSRRLKLGDPVRFTANAESVRVFPGDEGIDV